METILVHAQLSAVLARVWESSTLMGYFWEHEVAVFFFLEPVYLLNIFLGIHKNI